MTFIHTKPIKYTYRLYYYYNIEYNIDLNNTNTVTVGWLLINYANIYAVFSHVSLMNL